MARARKTQNDDVEDLVKTVTSWIGSLNAPRIYLLDAKPDLGNGQSVSLGLTFACEPVIDFTISVPNGKRRLRPLSEYKLSFDKKPGKGWTWFDGMVDFLYGAQGHESRKLEDVLEECLRQHAALADPASSSSSLPGLSQQPVPNITSGGSSSSSQTSSRSGRVGKRKTVASKTNPVLGQPSPPKKDSTQPQVVTTEAASEGDATSNDAEAEEKCAICLEPLSAQPVKTLPKCKHSFHCECLDLAFLHGQPVCPMCKTRYGCVKAGNQPDGRMTWRICNGSLPGFPPKKHIMITYSIFDGIQGVLKLLKLAFDSRLTFTVGRSITTGMDNVVVWNGIHHKTSPHGGPFGYPDAGYLGRVTAELSDFGITEDMLT